VRSIGAYRTQHEICSDFGASCGPCIAFNSSALACAVCPDGGGTCVGYDDQGAASCASPLRTNPKTCADGNGPSAACSGHSGCLSCQADSACSWCASSLSTGACITTGVDTCPGELRSVDANAQCVPHLHELFSPPECVGWSLDGSVCANGHRPSISVDPDQTFTLKIRTDGKPRYAVHICDNLGCSASYPNVECFDNDYAPIDLTTCTSTGVADGYIVITAPSARNAKIYYRGGLTGTIVTSGGTSQ